MHLITYYDENVLSMNYHPVLSAIITSAATGRNDNKSIVVLQRCVNSSEMAHELIPIINHDQFTVKATKSSTKAEKPRG